ncbi:MAG: hypothetical protein IPP26_01030 [Flavobacteriales bacterium]|nr:hypothetical protein [Flavobacteriales bacterium]
MLRSSVSLVAMIAYAAVRSQCITTFPATENFTSGTVGTPGTLTTGWSNLTTGDDLDWFVDNNGTPTDLTGPIGDHTSNNTSGNYMYVEASGGTATPGKVAILQSNCFDLTTLTNSYLTFWYHMQGSQMGALYVDISVGGVITSNAWSISGDQGLKWKQGWLNLQPFAGQNNVRIRFRAVTGAGELSDIAIDDVVVRSLVPVLGCPDVNASNYNSAVNINNGSCQYACPVGFKRVTIEIINDNYPQETSWTLKDASTNTNVATGTSTGVTLCVPANACLVFRINDSAGDGIYHPSYGYGAYFLYVDGVLIFQGGQFGAYQETTLNCGPGQSCTTAVAAQTGVVYTSPAVEYWYTWTPAQTGSYTITTCGLNTCDTKLWMYDMVCGSITVSSGLEGSTFADDDLGGCGQQARITANMPANQLYRIRVGTNNGSCTNVSFRIDYNGPAVGCMNTSSCNYDPLATVACTNCCLALGDPACPFGPDLTIDQASMQGSLSLSTVTIATTDVCAVQEGCVKGFGQRYVIRFNTRINNIGETDYYIGSPSSQPQMFSTNNCHGHAHYSGYADYLLFDQNSNPIPVGFKNGYCVIDVGCFGGTSHYGCSNMGISKDCYDLYGSGTTCNWIDITDVPAGLYTLVLRTNWERRPDALGRHEMDYTNNYASVCVSITRNAQNVPSFTVATGCTPVVDCMGQSYGSAKADCAGACNGTTKTGDLSLNNAQDQPDAVAYVQGILGNDVTPAPCTDLNGDAAITVTDAALMTYCYNQQSQHDQTSHVLHYHPWCDFPRGYRSTVDTVQLMIGAFNPTDHYVDIHIRNTTCRVLGVEFEISGMQVQSVETLAGQLVGDWAWNSSLGGGKVIGLSYIDTSLAKGTGYVPLCRVHYLSLTNNQVCIASITDIVNKDANNVVAQVANGCITVSNVVTVRPQVFLEGPFNGAGSMADLLRAQDVIPLSEPYTGLGFVHVNGGGGEIVPASILDITGNDAMVDWVLVEVRSATTPSLVLATRSALVQRDGDVVGIDGVSPVLLNVPPGNYHVAVRHRNHLGVMSSMPLALSGNAVTVDFRASATATYGTGARKNVNGYMVLWAGNVFRDGAVSSIRYTGQNNDRDPILSVIGGITPTAVVSGYLREDVDLSGFVKYTGAGNDRDPILVNIGGLVPTNTRAEQLP